MPSPSAYASIWRSVLCCPLECSEISGAEWDNECEGRGRLRDVPTLRATRAGPRIDAAGIGCAELRLCLGAGGRWVMHVAGPICCGFQQLRFPRSASVRNRHAPLICVAFGTDLC